MATVSLLTLKGRFFRCLGTHKSITATGGSTSKFTVASLADLEANAFKGWQIRVLTGGASGDLRVLGAGPDAAGALEPKRAFSASISAGSVGPPAVAADTAELWGNSIDGGSDLTALYNDVLTVARPYVPTEITIVTGQRIYDITTSVKSPQDVRRVFLRSLDSSALLPYYDTLLSGWHAYEFANASTAAREIKLDLGQTFTLDASVNTLWMRHYKTLTAFATDASTVEAEFADWLAWEAVLRHAVNMSVQTKSDKGNWAMLAEQAKWQVQTFRAQFMPYVPKCIRPFEASF